MQTQRRQAKRKKTTSKGDAEKTASEDDDGDDENPDENAKPEFPAGPKITEIREKKKANGQNGFGP